MNSNILIADTDKDLTQTLSSVLSRVGFNCKIANVGKDAIKFTKQYNFDILIVNVTMPQWSGLEILEKTSKISPKTLVVMITENATVESALEALRKGAVDYFIKPLDIEAFTLRIKKIKKFQQVLLENHYLRQEIHTNFNFNKIIGDSAAIQDIFHMINKVAHSSSNILITGRSGTGKELVARAIHQSSNRAKAPFVPINCSAIPVTLFESELFGFKKGSFTGAFMDKDGVFKAANGGTLFLDEVGEIPLNIQVKLLRAIESKEIKPIGSPGIVKVDVRILSATNRDLEKEIEEGNFREDLYYRLNIVELPLPALKTRRDDIPLLVDHFIHKYNKELKRNVLGADNETMKALINYEWKGEVRELENVIERAVLLCDTEYITLKDLPPNANIDCSTKYHDDLKLSVRNFERQHIMSILRRVEHDKNKCAEILNIGLSSLYRKIDELGIKE